MLGLLLIPAYMLVQGGCTGEFEKINTDTGRLSELTASDNRSLFPSAVMAGLNSAGYIVTTALFAGVYSQHFASTQPAHMSHRYLIVQDWVSSQWRNTYVSAMPALYTIIEQTRDKEPTLNAIARIWKVFVLHRTTDYWGPIPYSQIGAESTVIEYDAQKDIYYDFFKELDEAATLLKDNLDKPSFADKDLIYNGDNAKWLKFANTLRLRLALRISNVEPGKAKEEAEKAVAGGVFTELSDNAFMEVSPTIPNGFNLQSGWNESRMSSTMESLLKGYNDPRMEKFFRPAVTDGQFRGVRNGMSQAQQNIPENSFENSSDVSLKLAPINMNTTPQTCMYTAEAYFLRAEGAVNGWDMGGTAKELYEKGIEMSMLTWEVTDPSVIANYINGTSLPMAPGGYFNTPALTDIPVKFADDESKQREQIGTQKWLALFPESHEAWAEIRRSGYPKMYPLINSDNPDVPKEKMIRRITFLDIEKNSNGPAVSAAEALLGGPDKASTPLWWDTIAF
ncbi:MAG TPA: SusD/RagB family nutrient-binding outer membrane lipoprotein [Cyclobacteriaceae bacterium]|nr:SusD/RagB family nutrient-binding outer membrane lipoprotein [Cyclobacteriaceae bacterium]